MKYYNQLNLVIWRINVKNSNITLFIYKLRKTRPIPEPQLKDRSSRIRLKISISKYNLILQWDHKYFLQILTIFGWEFTILKHYIP